MLRRLHKEKQLNKPAKVMETQCQPSKVASKQKSGRKKGLAERRSSSDAECCLVCGESFEGALVQFSVCEQWAHED